jgi:cobalt-zinc-cadmium efflux system membrane fusion protein
MRNSGRLQLYWLVSSAMLCSLLLSCGSGPDEAPEAEATNGAERETLSDRVQLAPEALAHLALEYFVAEELELQPSLKVSAELLPVPDRHAEVGTLVSGRIGKVHVNVGDSVELGTPLLDVDSPGVGRARAELIKARAELEVARAAQKRERRLLTERATSKREVEIAEGALKTTRARYSAAQALLATLGAGDEPQTTPENAARVVIKSPVSGTVVSRDAHVGRAVEPGGTLIEIVDLDELWLLADVYERDLRLVAEGQTVTVSVQAYPDAGFSGTVDHISGTIDRRTRAAKVRVVLPNTDRRLRPGMFATAHIEGTHGHAPQRTLAVPASAIQTIDDHRAVFVRVGDGLFELRRVHTGERAGELVEVLNGIAPGEQVVADGSFLLKGQLLRSTLAEEE